ncbi:GatB/YqeY domain-containing protein [Luminiphilus sp.]|nr:GatB/YqeY domain-containing protein [Luminiphilus sp.]
MSETLSLVEQVKAAMKAAMKAREKQTLSAIRLIQADFKRIEVDERIEIDDARAIAIMDKMVKQRRDSAKQYRDADRPELADQEDAEIIVIQTFLPEQLSAADVDALIDEALAGIEATGMAAMGQLMGKLKPQLQGRADMGEVSQRVKAKLGT